MAHFKFAFLFTNFYPLGFVFIDFEHYNVSTGLNIDQ